MHIQGHNNNEHIKKLGTVFSEEQEKSLQCLLLTLGTKIDIKEATNVNTSQNQYSRYLIGSKYLPFKPVNLSEPNSRSPLTGKRKPLWCKICQVMGTQTLTLLTCDTAGMLRVPLSVQLFTI